MSAGFTIDLDEVGKLVETLEHAEERMTKATERLRDVGLLDLGSPFLDKAAGEFQEDWEHGIGEIADLTGDITEGLRAAMKVYRQLDESVSDTFRGEQGKVGGSVDVDVRANIAQRLAGEW